MQFMIQYGIVSVGDLDIDQAEMDFSLPQEFIDEWKRLKGYEI